MLIAQKLSLTFGQQVVFDDVSFTIQSNEKLGLVGRNGAGKSTLLKVLAGKQQLDSGIISIERGKKLAYMPQDVVLLSEKTVLEETMTVFDEGCRLLEETVQIEAQLCEEDADHDTLLERYQECQSRLAELNLPGAEVEAKRVLQGLGLGPERWELRVDQLSVGWKMRVVLAQLLLQKADLYLFDEPTNHLDIVAQGWFLEFLKRSEASFVLVSHDRYFLDHVCDNILEVEQGNATEYVGNYSAYLEQKAYNDEMKQRAYDAQQRDIKKKMDFVNRFRASASRSSQAQSVLKAVEKIERIEIVNAPSSLRFSIQPVTRAGEIVLKVRDIAKSYDNKRLFQNVAFDIPRGEKVALVAANGVGKTTLLSIIMGKTQADSGEFTFGHNVTPVLFEQDQERSLTPTKTVLDEVEDSCITSTSRARVRSMLGSFLFSGDDVAKRIKVLSGGEKNRVAMVKVLLAEGNTLLLDEPTNHLDLQAKEILAKVLKQYDGTILFVSHDRTFLDELATRILELTPQGVRSYKGNYESYVYAKHQEELKARQEALAAKPKQPVKQEAAPVEVPAGKDDHEKRRKMTNLESKIAKLEREVEDLNASFTTVEWGSDAYKKIEAQHLQLKKQLQDAYDQWELLAPKA